MPISRTGTSYCNFYSMSKMLFFFPGIRHFALPAAGLFSCSRLRGTQGTRLYTTVQVWVPAGLRGACSGRSKSRNLASDHGVAFRGARAEQDSGKRRCHLFCSTCCKVQQHGSNNRFKLSSVSQLLTLRCVCGPLLCVCGDVCVLCVCSVRVCTCVTHASSRLFVAKDTRM